MFPKKGAPISEGRKLHFANRWLLMALCGRCPPTSLCDYRTSSIAILVPLGPSYIHHLNVLRHPPDPFPVTCSKIPIVSTITTKSLISTRGICCYAPRPRSSHSPCLITTLHMKTSMGRIPSNGTLPLPVVCHKPNWCRRSSSLTASG